METSGHNGEVTDNEGVTLRTGTAGDVDTVLDLWVAAGAHTTSTDDAPAVSTLIAADGEALLIAEIDGQMVGTLIAVFDGWRGNMYRLAVLPAVRRRGIAAALVAEGERRMRALGCRRVTALVADGDDGAAEFWSHVDYVRYAMERYVHTLGPPPASPGRR
jgi:ribosomal protein S18 acetylase RimI-like enzyme